MEFEQIADGLITQTVYEQALAALGNGTPTREQIVAFAAQVFRNQERDRVAGHALDALEKLRPLAAAAQAEPLEALIQSFRLIFGFESEGSE